ncbi:PRC-barrel domain-containing protein [Sabulibacter ruber]|uniref:PRC-barrel domain-containing protein n=1 Tax=Sabulibacter ruber TaxID=2811901 RepID=UPI001A95CB8B|nr:PRC-barrel domain-containing protein [Sabulibacter ruber]
MENTEDTTSKTHLQELGDIKFDVAKGQSDIRGWQVRDQQGKKLGKVTELLCDLQARKVRYLILDLKDNELELSPKDVLIPIGLAELHETDDVVVVQNVTPAHLQALPEYASNTFSQETEIRVQRIFMSNHVHGASPSPALEQPRQDYSHEHYNQTNLYRNRKPRKVIGLFEDAGSVQRVTQKLLNKGFKPENIETTIRQPGQITEESTPGTFEQYFYSLFDTPDEAQPYQNQLQHSSALVVIHAYSPAEIQEATEILDRHRTSELEIQVEHASGPEATTEFPPAQPSPFMPSPEAQPQSPEYGNAPQATPGNQAWEAPQEQYELAREERMVVERLPINHPVTGAEFGSFQAGVIELTEFAEVPILTKEARVVEEIVIGKEVEIHEEIIHETVRNTEVQVEELRSNYSPRTTPPTS